MTSLNYILLVHDQPELLRRIISKLSHPISYFYIHIDKNTDIQPFKEKLRFFSNIYFIPEESREEGTWGGFGIVKATLAAMKEINAINKDGYTILLSGQDYPLQNANNIISFFNKNKFEYVDINKLTPSSGNHAKLNRLKEYRFNLSSKRYNYIKIPSIWDSSFYTYNSLKKCYSLIIRNKYKNLKLLLSKRKLPYELKPYTGSQWWALSNLTITKILTFIEKNPNYLKFHEHTLISDELFFQIIIAEIRRKENNLFLKNSITYTNWTRKNTQLPVTFNINDKKELYKASKSFLFARKFNLEFDTDILDWIDDNLH